MASSTHPAVHGMKFTEEVACSEVVTGAWFPMCTNPIPRDLSSSCSISHEDPREETVRQESLPECTRTAVITNILHKQFTSLTVFLWCHVWNTVKERLTPRLESKLNYLTYERAKKAARKCSGLRGGSLDGGASTRPARPARPLCMSKAQMESVNTVGTHNM